MPKGRPKKEGGRVVTTNIKVSKTAHSLVMTAANKLGMSMSDALIYLITEKFPKIDEELAEREENMRKLEERKRQINSN